MAARKDGLCDRIHARLLRSSLPLEASQLAEQFGRTTKNVHQSLKLLESRGLVRPVGDAKRFTRWEAVQEPAKQRAVQ